MGSPLHIEKYFESFEDAVKRRDQLLSFGFFDPIIKKMCKEEHGHSNYIPTKLNMVPNRYRRNRSSFGCSRCNANSKRGNISGEAL